MRVAILWTQADNLLCYGEIFDSPPPGTGVLNQAFFDMYALIGSDVAPLVALIGGGGALITWTLSLYSARFLANAPTFEDPIDSTRAWIAEVVFQGSQVERCFGNHISQTLPPFQFTTAAPQTGYPHLPATPNVSGTREYLQSFEPFVKPGDGVYLRSQFADMSSIFYKLQYAAYINEPISGVISTVVLV